MSAAVEAHTERLAKAEAIEQVGTLLQWQWLSAKEQWEMEQALTVEPEEFQPYPEPRPKAEHLGTVRAAYERALAHVIEGGQA